jgi:hypothetical protein
VPTDPMDDDECQSCREEIGLYKFASVVPDALGGTFDFESVDLA